nr:VOC family protein [Angustibacter aerolatus]
MRVEVAGDDPQQRRLAGAVRPHQRDDRTVADAEAHLVEQRPPVRQHEPDGVDVDVAHDDECAAPHRHPTIAFRARPETRCAPGRRAPTVTADPDGGVAWRSTWWRSASTGSTRCGSAGSGRACWSASSSSGRRGRPCCRTTSAPSPCGSCPARCRSPDRTRRTPTCGRRATRTSGPRSSGRWRWAAGTSTSGSGPRRGTWCSPTPRATSLCVVEAGNGFLAGCGRFGALSSDGLRDVGVFWAAALDWPLVWDQDEETAVQSPHGGTKIAWGGPPLARRDGPNRVHVDLVPVAGADLDHEVERLLGLGAAHLPPDGWPGAGHAPSDDGRVVLTDPGGNPFCVLPPGSSS